MAFFSKTPTHSDLEKSFKEYYSPLCKYAFSFLSDQELCEDLVQDVFLKLWDKSPQINKSVSAYLYKAVKNACLDHIKSKFKQVVVSIEDVEDPIDSSFEYNREENLQEIQLKIEQAVNQLPPKCKEIFLMRRNMQMSYDEIAESLNISKKTIENHMNTAIKKLRSQLHKSELLIYFLLLLHNNK